MVAKSQLFGDRGSRIVGTEVTGSCKSAQQPVKPVPGPAKSGPEGMARGERISAAGPSVLPSSQSRADKPSLKPWGSREHGREWRRAAIATRPCGIRMRRLVRVGGGLPAGGDLAAVHQLAAAHAALGYWM